MAPKTITVQLPSKADMPVNNEESLARFGEAVNALLSKFKATAKEDTDTKKKIRRQLRKLGYKLAGDRQRGIMTIEL